jgi:hypothetical protein
VSDFDGQPVGTANYEHHKPDSSRKYRRSFGIWSLALMVMSLSNPIVFNLIAFRVLGTLGYVDWIRRGTIDVSLMYQLLRVTSTSAFAIATVTALVCCLRLSRQHPEHLGIWALAMLTLVAFAAYFLAPVLVLVAFNLG